MKQNKRWIQTFTGKAIDPTNLNESDIDIRDIAHALSQINRFTGHAPYPYSVAQHSVLCSYLVPPEHALWALLHDASEAYLTDISSPLKVHLPDYKRIEARAMKVICSFFRLDQTQPAPVKIADEVMLSTEARDLFPEVQRPRDWELKREPSHLAIVPWTHTQANIAFLYRFYELRDTNGKPESLFSTIKNGHFTAYGNSDKARPTQGTLGLVTVRSDPSYCRGDDIWREEIRCGQLPQGNAVEKVTRRRAPTSLRVGKRAGQGSRKRT